MPALAHAPANYSTVCPYLVVEDAPAFIAFAETVIGATLLPEPRYREDGTLMHGQLQIGDTLVMVSQANADYPVQTAMLFVWVDDADATYHLGLAHGAESLQAPSDESYGRACGFCDANGILWWPASVSAA